MRAVLWSGVLCLSLAACSSNSRSTAGGPGASGPATNPSEDSRLLSIEVAPKTAAVAAAAGQPGIAAFKAIGTFEDGHTADVSSKVSWSVGAASLGAIDALGQFTSNTDHGGTSVITASTGTASAEASILVKFSANRVSTDNGSTAPMDSALFFQNAAADPTTALSVVYPLDDTYVPKNLSTLGVHWRTNAAGNPLNEISFLGPTLALRIYTNSPPTGAGPIFFLTASDWKMLVDSAAGSRLEARVRSLSPGGKVAASVPVSVTVGFDDVAGGLYYWTVAPGGTSAIMRHDFGQPALSPQKFFSNSDLVPLTGASHCVGCHSLSQDGTKLFVSYGDGNPDWGAVVDVATKQAVPTQTAGRWIFSSFSPDNTRIVATYHTGTLAIYDLTGAGAAPQTIDTTGIVMDAAVTMASHPNWSADGKSIVFALGTPDPGNSPSEWNVMHASLVILTDDGSGHFGSPRVLVQSLGENNYYPSFSPDDKWVLFNRATSGVAYNNAGAQIYAVPADGSKSPVFLASATAQVDSTDSWPRWTPFLQSNKLAGQSGGAGTLYYFTFSSKRDVGNSIVGVARTQLWMAAFDPDRVTEAHPDPTYSPFWLPFQDSATDNHAAQWTQVIVPAIN